MKELKKLKKKLHVLVIHTCVSKFRILSFKFYIYPIPNISRQYRMLRSTASRSRRRASGG